MRKKTEGAEPLRPGLFLLGALLLVLVIPAGNGWAGAERQWLVRSEYRDPMLNRVTEISWQFTVSGEAGSGKGYRLQIRDSENRVENWAELTFSGPGKLVAWDDFRLVRGRVSSRRMVFDDDRPALSENSLVPGDWLNLELPYVFHSESREYRLYRQVGPSRFVDRLLVEERPVPLNEAEGQGWVTPVNRAAAGRKLFMVTVYRLLPQGDREMVARQLWAGESRFWLYEEHGRRRSWYCVPGVTRP